MSTELAKQIVDRFSRLGHRLSTHNMRFNLCQNIPNHDLLEFIEFVLDESAKDESAKTVEETTADSMLEIGQLSDEITKLLTDLRFQLVIGHDVVPPELITRIDSLVIKPTPKIKDKVKIMYLGANDQRNLHPKYLGEEGVVVGIKVELDYPYPYYVQVPGVPIMQFQAKELEIIKKGVS